MQTWFYMGVNHDTSFPLSQRMPPVLEKNPPLCRPACHSALTLICPLPYWTVLPRDGSVNRSIPCTSNNFQLSSSGHTVDMGPDPVPRRWWSLLNGHRWPTRYLVTSKRPSGPVCCLHWPPISHACVSGDLGLSGVVHTSGMETVSSERWQRGREVLGNCHKWKTSMSRWALIIAAWDCKGRPAGRGEELVLKHVTHIPHEQKDCRRCIRFSVICN